MAIRRSNPWPALADLFAALLVTTFAGLIVMDFVAKSAAAGADPTTLEGKVAKLSEELANQKAGFEAQLAQARQEADQREELLAHYEAQVGQGGIDPPPCMLVGGRPQPLVEIAVLSGGQVEVTPLDLGSFGQLAGEIPGYQQLRTPKPIARENLAGIARQAHAWGRSTQNSFGYECVFYARISIKTESVGELAKTLTYVNELFYTLNHADIHDFYRRGGG